MTVFPAYAGMSRRGTPGTESQTGFPRLRGDEPAVNGQTFTFPEFSPPTRG